MIEDVDDNRRRVKMLRVGVRDLAAILSGELVVEDGVPEGALIRGVSYDFQLESFYMLIQHWSFDAVDEGARPPECSNVVVKKSAARRGIALDHQFMGHYAP